MADPGPGLGRSRRHGGKCTGVSRISFSAGPINYQALIAFVKHSPKITTICALAAIHSRGDIFQSFSARFSRPTTTAEYLHLRHHRANLGQVHVIVTVPAALRLRRQGRLAMRAAFGQAAFRAIGIGREQPRDTRAR